MEINGIGPCVFIDTAGFDDVGGIGEHRKEQTQKVVDKTDIAIMVFDGSHFISKSIDINDYALKSMEQASLLTDEELHWLKALKKKRIPVIGVLNKIDLYSNIVNDESENGEDEISRFDKTAQIDDYAAQLANTIEKTCNIPVIPVSTITQQGLDSLREQLIRSLPEDFESDSITGSLAQEGDVVLLVMPQDIQAPKGSLFCLRFRL